MKYTISTMQLTKDRWQAVINDGWWVAYGKTEKDAIKRVVTLYTKETIKAEYGTWSYGQ